jgi:flagellar biosynthesis protein FliR
MPPSPRPSKSALTLVLTVLIHPLHASSQLGLRPWQWAAAALGEVVIGLLLGLAANFMMEGPLLAGQILGLQMGYTLASLFDPQTQADTPVLSTLHQLAALMIFLQLDVHHWLLRALVRSFHYLPPGEARATGTATAALLHGAGGIFLAGVQIAAPALVATLIADAALGFLGKASPQLPVLFVGLSVKNLLGLAMLLATVAYWPRSFAMRFADSVALGERLLHLAH